MQSVAEIVAVSPCRWQPLGFQPQQRWQQRQLLVLRAQLWQRQQRALP